MSVMEMFIADGLVGDLIVVCRVIALMKLSSASAAAAPLRLGCLLHCEQVVGIECRGLLHCEQLVGRERRGLLHCEQVVGRECRGLLHCEQVVGIEGCYIVSRLWGESAEGC